MKKFKEIFVTVVIFLLLFSATAYGMNWSTNKRLTNNTAQSFTPDIALDGSNIYVVWTDRRWGNFEIYFKRSVDGGATWSTKKRLTNNEGDSYSPAIAVDGSNIYVVWTDRTPGNYDIYFKKSGDGGVTWTADDRLTNNAGDSIYPAIAVNGSNVYVAWTDWIPGDNEIYFKRSGDGGATWTADERLTENAGSSYSPAIAVDGSNIYVVWEDNTSGDFEIYLKKSVDRGDTWSTKKRLTHNAGISDTPAIAVDGLNIYIVWHDTTPGNHEIYFKESGDGWATWSAGKRTTHNAGISDTPAIAVDGSNIYIVWHDTTPGNDEIYFKESGDGGATWSAGKRLTTNIGVSRNPAIAVDASSIYVVWWDDTPGNAEIYFKKGLRP